MSEARGLLFDLDDTLYRVRRFALSGFRAVARALALRGYDEQTVLRTLVGAYRRPGGLRPFQALERVIGPVDLDLLTLYREHVPTLRLPEASRWALETLRSEWRVGVITNGPPAQQRRKVSALGLEPLVDAVCYAHEISARGKPDPEVFRVALARLGVAAHATVVVGDDPVCDIAGAHAVGCRTILVARTTVAAEGADAIVERIVDVPGVAARLVAGREAA